MSALKDYVLKSGSSTVNQAQAAVGVNRSVHLCDLLLGRQGCQGCHLDFTLLQAKHLRHQDPRLTPPTDLRPPLQILYVIGPMGGSADSVAASVVDMLSTIRSTGAHLILDQRQQRADDERAASGKQGWQLVAQTLASSRRHQTQDVTALHGRIDHLTLLRPVNMASQYMPLRKP